MNRRGFLRFYGLLASAALLGCQGKPAEELPIYWEAPSFELLDQRGDTVRTADLEGRIWVASFVFTHCIDVCPLISARMASLRDELRAQGVLGRQVRLVSFSVDPARDTPPVLAEYAERFGAGTPREWAFLTGTPPEAVHRLVQEGFHLTAMPMPSTPDDSASGYQIAHAPRLVLVDRAGQVRGTYDVTEAEALERLRADLRYLLDRPSGRAGDENDRPPKGEAI